MTGAPIPEGSDCVVMKEDSIKEGKDVLIFRECKQGENVRYKGEDIKKGDIVTAVIVRTRKEFMREDGSYIRFGDNAAVIIKGGDKDDAIEPIATRIFGPIAREIKDKGYSSIVSKAPEVL
jgi:ribosomal protein L14